MLDIAGAAGLLRTVGLRTLRSYRLPTADLMIARR